MPSTLPLPPLLQNANLVRALLFAFPAPAPTPTSRPSRASCGVERITSRGPPSSSTTSGALQGPPFSSSLWGSVPTGCQALLAGKENPGNLSKLRTSPFSRCLHFAKRVLYWNNLPSPPMLTLHWWNSKRRTPDWGEGIFGAEEAFQGSLRLHQEGHQSPP